MKATVKRDCALWDDKNKGCKGLTELLCAVRECPFYKTKEKICEEEERGKARREELYGVDPKSEVRIAVSDYGQSRVTKLGDNNSIKSRKRYRRLIEQRRCVNCGKPNERGGALCDACKELRKEQKIARENSKQEKN